MSRDNEKIDIDIKIIIGRYLKSYENFQELDKDLKEDKDQYKNDGLAIKEYFNKQLKQGIDNPKIIGKKYNIIYKKRKGMQKIQSLKKVKEICKKQGIPMEIFHKLISQGKETSSISVERKKEINNEIEEEIEIV